MELLIDRGIANLASEVIMLAVWFLVIGRIIEGTLSPGDFAVVYLYFRRLRNNSRFFARLWLRIQDDVAGLQRVFSFMDMPGDQNEEGFEPGAVSEGVAIRHASLTYADGRQALRDINLQARVGEIIALTGPTGAGKTSLAHP